MNCLWTLVAFFAFFPASRAFVGLLDDEEEVAEVQLMQGRPNVVQLNRQTFGGNVLAQEGYSRHWMVLFCVDWYPPCQALDAPYMGMAENYSQVLNKNVLFENFVRFGSVDCAVDKVLCNEQSIQTYPVVAHYAEGQQLKQWTGGSEQRDQKSFRKWLHNELLDAKLKATEVKPLFTMEERRVVFKMLASFAASLSLLVWAVGRGADLWLLYTARHNKGKQPKAAVDKADKQDLSQEQQSKNTSPLGDHMKRCLPEEWAAQRGTVEL